MTSMTKRNLQVNRYKNALFSVVMNYRELIDLLNVFFMQFVVLCFIYWISVYTTSIPCRCHRLTVVQIIYFDPIGLSRQHVCLHNAHAHVHCPPTHKHTRARACATLIFLFFIFKILFIFVYFIFYFIYLLIFLPQFHPQSPAAVVSRMVFHLKHLILLCPHSVFCF
jgi:hypothetical protein